MSNEEILAERIDKLTEIGISLSAEKDLTQLLENILIGAKELCNADAGTLYTIHEDENGKRIIKPESLHNDTLGIFQGDARNEKITIPSIPLLNPDGTKNLENVVSYSVNCHETVNIENAYNYQGSAFEGMRKIADELGYRSESFLTVPMQNHMGDIIGVLQLINAQSDITGSVISFSKTMQKLVEALASQAAIALTNQQLINEQKTLLESIIQLVATAIDEKSPYTGDHCRRVPILTMMLADAAHRTSSGPLKSFEMTSEQRYELEIAAWLHDCGKITTPEYIIDKATKLETIHDRITDISTRFEVLKRDNEVAEIKKYIAKKFDDLSEMELSIQTALDNYNSKADEQLSFLRKHNTGGEFMAEGDIQEIRNIGKTTWQSESSCLPLLSDNEIYNLSTRKGTLTEEEREVINHHIVATINMLESLPFPKHLSNVPEFAGGHHERMDGKGYPNGLTREQMSVQARVMGIADIFEALTARDRPYKKGKTLTEALRILGFMCEDNHIDADLFHLFIEQKLYQQYAENYMDHRQIDEVDLASIPGYRESLQT